MNIYGKRLKGYESIHSENFSDSEGCTLLKAIKYLICIIIFLIIVVIAIYLFRHYQSKSLYINEDPQQFKNINPNLNQNQQFQLQLTKQYTISDFYNILPKNDINGNNIVNIKDIFQSRKLFINDKNITSDYFHFLHPINQKEEQQYTQVSNQNYVMEDYVNMKRQGQMNLNDFYTFCDKETLLQSNKYTSSQEPIISIIIALISKKPEITRTINSIQCQTFRNSEIIIVDDCLDGNMNPILNNIFENEYRSRIFKHEKSMGLWRTRLDGFLYAKGKYILHIDPGDILADNYVLEDIYNIITKYNLDTVRFSFSKTRYHAYFNQNKKFNDMKIYPYRHTKIIYGRPDYDVHEFGYGTIWNRLFRANVFVKAVDFIDIHILNAYKDLWEDMWWNDLIDRVSYSNLVVNRLGYLYLYNRKSPSEPKIRDNDEKDKTIREFIYFWLFDYELLPKNDNKKQILETLHKYIRKDNTFCRLPMSLTFLKSSCPAYEHLLVLLYNDPYVSNDEKKFVQELYNKAPRNKI